MKMDLIGIPILVIGGPTGVGKTNLSIELAERFNGEVINGDSLQVYKHLDIGTGKISHSEMHNVVHHLIDELNVENAYNASQFKHDATDKIKDIHQRGKLPIIVGGTGLYLEGLLYDLEFGQNGSQDDAVREELEQLAEEIGNEALWNKLNDIDPEAALKIPYQNVRRTIRALEVIEITGDKFSNQSSHKEHVSVFNESLIILTRERSELYERINGRVHKMIELGLEEEAKWLYNTSNGQEWKSIKGIGYKEWWPYFEGRIDKEDVIQAIQQNSRRYAKRQLTWFRNRMKDPNWIDVTNESDALDKAVEIVKSHLHVK